MGVPAGTNGEAGWGGLGLASLEFPWALGCRVCPYCLCLAFEWLWRGDRGPEYESLKEEVGVYRLWAPCTYERRVLYYLSELAGQEQTLQGEQDFACHVTGSETRLRLDTVQSGYLLLLYSPWTYPLETWLLSLLFAMTFGPLDLKLIEDGGCTFFNAKNDNKVYRDQPDWLRGLTLGLVY